MKLLIGKRGTTLVIFYPGAERVQLNRDFDCNGCNARFQLGSEDLGHIFSRLDEIKVDREEGMDREPGKRFGSVIHFVSCPICGGFVVIGQEEALPEDWGRVLQVAS